MRIWMLAALSVGLGPHVWGKDTWVLSDTRVNHLLAGDVCGKIGLEEGRMKTKRMGVGDWAKPKQEFSWPVTTSAAGSCTVELLVSLPEAGAMLVLSSNADRVEVSAQEAGWQRVPATLKVDKTDTIKLKLKQAIVSGKSAAIMGIEVITVTHLPDYKRQFAEIRTPMEDAAWFQNAGFGIMFQWGSWGYPATGDRKQPWSRIYQEFDIEKFADKMKSFNPGYVIWSVSWRGSRFAAPLKSVEQIMGSKDFTMEYDFLGKLTDALTKRGIPVMFYYHPGSEEKEYWGKVWHGHEDMAVWEDANAAIWTEIGERLGNKLSGWFVDDGMVHYYPADFYRYMKALKAGNSKRLVAFNNWVFCNCSPLEDVTMGEVGPEGKIEGGRLASGKDKGLMPHTMTILDGPDWGVHRKDTKIKSIGNSLEKWQKRVDQAKRDKSPISLTILMYEDGTLGPDTEALFNQLKR